MAKISPAGVPYRNEILAALAPQTLERLAPQSFDFPLGKVLYEPNAPIEYAYFPEHGMISIVAVMSNGANIEVGTIGREGMAGSSLLLETATAPNRYLVQIEGNGYRVAARALLATATADHDLRDAILRYEAVFRTHTMQGMACNGLHNIEQRLCRWLLMSRDRIDSDEIKLTHEFLAQMLGVRRSSVSEVLAPFQEMELIRSSRGVITLINRKALEERVCECYWIMSQRERER
jgi:CRP-like cAMP-binding protein